MGYLPSPSLFYLGLHGVNGVTSLDLECDGLAGQCLHEDLHVVDVGLILVSLPSAFIDASLQELVTNNRNFPAGQISEEGGGEERTNEPVYHSKKSLRLGSVATTVSPVCLTRPRIVPCPRVSCVAHGALVFRIEKQSRSLNSRCFNI